MKKKHLALLAALALTASGIIVYQTVFNSVDTLNRSKGPWEWRPGTSSIAANDYFWTQFHAGNYDSIPLVLEKLTAAYLENPHDLLTVYHLGFGHFWALAERQHLDEVPPTVLDHAVLAQKYLGEAYRMNPADARLLSFLASAKIIVGSVSQDDKLVTEGYLNGLKSIRHWEDFGAFSLAYTFSRLPHTDPNFQKTLKWMEETANRCYCEDFDPRAERCIAAIAAEVKNPKTLGRNRIVPNSWVAPHNIEGFFMSWGDLLVKNGDWEKAIPVYKLAKHAPGYTHWDYRHTLENRIRHARQNVDFFRKDLPQGQKVSTDRAMMVETAIACRACHQMSRTDLSETYRDFDAQEYLDKEFYFLDVRPAGEVIKNRP